MADFRYSTNLIIPAQSSIQDVIANQEMNYVLNSLKTLATRIDETTGALSPPQTDWPNSNPAVTNLGNNIYKFYAICGDTPIAYGMFVNFFKIAVDQVSARPAQANGYIYAAGGYCVEPGGVAAGQYGEFQVGPGINYGIAGLTPGNWYFLSPTNPGLITATQPTTAGQIIQLVGQAITDRILQVGSFNNWLLL